MHQSIPPAPSPSPSPPPRLLRGICPPRQSRVGAFADFSLPGGRAFFNPRAIPKLLNTRGVFYQNITTQRVLLEKKQIGSSVKDRNKLKTVVKAFSRFYACFSSLLIKPKWQSEIGAVDVNQRFLVIESNLCWYYLKIIKLFITYNFTAFY